MTSNNLFKTYPGFVAFSPDGVCLGHSRNILELQTKLMCQQPALADVYQETLSEGGTWFCFIDHLLVYGLKLYVATEYTIQSLDDGNKNVTYEYCDNSRRIWVTGEASVAGATSLEELNMMIVEMAMEAELTQSFGIGIECETGQRSEQ